MTIAIKKILEQVQQIKRDTPKSEWVEYLNMEFAKLDRDSSVDSVVLASVYGIHLLKEFFDNRSISKRTLDSVAKATEQRIKFLQINDIKDAEILFSRFHLLLGKIDSQLGHYWRAVYNSSIAFDSVPNSSLAGKENQQIDTGINYLRLAMGTPAVAIFRKAFSTAKGPMWHRAGLFLGKSLRLVGKLEEAASLFSELSASDDVSHSFKEEYGWEQNCIEAVKTQKSLVVVKSVDSGEPLRKSSYLVEAKLWAFASDDEVLISRIPKITYLARNKDLNLNSQKPSFKALATFEDATDEVRSIEDRSNRINMVIDNLRMLESIEIEQLVLLSAANWFMRNRLYPTALMCIAAYEKNSLALTDGSERDHLRLTQEHYKQRWYKNRVA